MKADFSGYATKNGLKCSDGRTIMPDAFKHNDKQRVPLLWQHIHNDHNNVLGHAILENRADGVYAYGFFNGTPQGLNARSLVEHKDISSLSIYANQLVQKGSNVTHGDIKELSLVLAGANPGALIDNLSIQHGESVTIADDEAIIYTGLTLEHESLGDDMANTTETDKVEEESLTHEDSTDTKVETKDDAETGEDLKDIFDTMTEKQKNAVYFMLDQALGEDKSGDKTDTDNTADETSDGEEPLKHSQEDSNMSRNVFENNGPAAESKTLSHDQLAVIFSEAQDNGSFNKSMLAHAGEYGITDINLLFPDAKTIANSPELISRRMEWVSKVLGSTKHSPFAKVKSLTFDITAEEARAKGYIKGSMKKEEVVKLLRRTTGPTTVYKKQKLDRDDIIDITDLDVVAWLKAEIRIMLEEEIARCILFGDGRDELSEDKVADPAGSINGDGIRSILHDHELYSIKASLDANTSPKDAVKGMVRARTKYRGSGKPTLFISDNFLTDIMLEEDKFGRPLYETEQVLADKLRVESIVTVDIIDDTEDLLAIMVNLADYTIGANKGGELTSFEDFDIDYNQNKYLTETRISGGLTKPFSAVVIKRLAGTEAVPVAPTFNTGTNTITIPSVTGLVYTIDNVPVTGSKVITETTEVEVEAAENYYIKPNSTVSWTFSYTAP